MHSLNAAATCLALALLGCAGAPGAATPPNSRQIDDRQFLDDHRCSWTQAWEIPDGDHLGLLIGPVFTENDGGDLGDLALRVDIQHPATGDLDVWLAYDADGDGNPETRAPVEFFRSRSGIGVAELHACPAALDGSYFFQDDPAGADAVFAPFSKLPRGHAFYLAVADTLAGDTGWVLGWSIYTKESGPTALR